VTFEAHAETNRHGAATTGDTRNAGRPVKDNSNAGRPVKDNNKTTIVGFD